VRSQVQLGNEDQCSKRGEIRNSFPFGNFPFSIVRICFGFRYSSFEFIPPALDRACPAGPRSFREPMSEHRFLGIMGAGRLEPAMDHSIGERLQKQPVPAEHQSLVKRHRDLLPGRLRPIANRRRRKDHGGDPDDPDPARSHGRPRRGQTALASIRFFLQCEHTARLPFAWVRVNAISAGKDRGLRGSHGWEGNEDGRLRIEGSEGSPSSILYSLFSIFVTLSEPSVSSAVNSPCVAARKKRIAAAANTRSRGEKSIQSETRLKDWARRGWSLAESPNGRSVQRSEPTNPGLRPGFYLETGGARSLS